MANKNRSHHTFGKDGYFTAKSGDGVKNPSATAFASGKHDGGKTSITYNKDGSATRQRSGGGLSHGLGLSGKKPGGKTTL